MKKGMIAFLIVLYIMQLLFITGLILIFADGNPKVFFISGLAMMSIVFLVGVLNMGIACAGVVLDTKNTCLRTMIFKLALIPFYILNFFLWTCLIAGLLNPFLIWGVFIVFPLSIAFTYFIMLTTSLYNITYLLNKRRKNELLLMDYKWHIVFHFIFVLDVISSIILYIKQRKS